MSEILRKLSEANKRFDELDSIIKRLYEDNVTGKLTDERFVKLSKDYEIEQQTLTNFINETETTLSDNNSKKMNVSNFIAIANKYTTLSELTPTIVNELIDRIEIHKPDKSTGKRIQKVDIYYSFIGNLDTVEVKK